MKVNENGKRLEFGYTFLDTKISILFFIFSKKIAKMFNYEP